MQIDSGGNIYYISSAVSNFTVQSSATWTKMGYVLAGTGSTPSTATSSASMSSGSSSASGSATATTSGSASGSATSSGAAATSSKSSSGKAVEVSGLLGLLVAGFSLLL